MPAPGKGMPTHYNLKKLHVIFFLFSAFWFILLLVLVWQDYFREWRKYQKEFRKLDLQKTQIAIQAALDPEKQQQLEELRQRIAEAEQRTAEQKQAIERLQVRLRGIQTEHYLVDEEWRFAKSKRDALRYKFEQAQQTNDPDVDQKRRAYLEMDRHVDELFQRMRELEAEQKSVEQELNALMKDKLESEKRLKALTLNLQALQNRLVDLKPSLANYIRDLPMLDFMAPWMRIRQIYLQDLYYNFTFRFVERADRCVTCHLGIDDPDFADAPQPYRTHPRLDLMVGSNSPHPMNEFGCTICHMGRDRGTSFVTAAHTPRDEDQAEEWRERYDWKPLERWEEPMLPLQYTESSCMLCHQNRVWIPGADNLNRGLYLIRKLGCYGCHKIRGFEYLRKAGPSLEKIASKTTPEWAFKWIKNPLAFRPNWMPKFFDLLNTSDAVSRRRNNLEILGIVTYLFEKSKRESYPPVPVPGNPQRGKQLVEQLGCLGCHTLDPRDWAETPTESRRKFGPNLAYLGSKTTPEWLFAWLKNPKQYWNRTRMPSLRLTDQEAADITAYLIQQRNLVFDSAELPTIDTSLLDELITEHLQARLTRRQIAQRLQTMDEHQKLLFVGERAIARYGCFGCHDIPGFETALPIGTELSEEGDKSVHLLDFGYLNIEQNRWTWFTTKLRTPRIFDVGRAIKPWEKLRMPNFHLSEKDIRSVVTVILGLRNIDIVGPGKREKMTERDYTILEGWKFVDEHNCVGCHQITRFGGDIRTVFEKLGLPPGMEPPILKYEDLPGIGARVRSDWLYHFLKEPFTVRPWLKVRMPSFNFTDQEINTLTHFFSALDDVPFPFEEQWFEAPPREYVEEGKTIFEQLRCAQCHITGPVDLTKVDASTLAPDLRLVRERLRPDWIIQWLKDPSGIMPGTKMPTYPWQYLPYMNGDIDRMVLAIRNYLLSLGTPPQSRRTASRP